VAAVQETLTDVLPETPVGVPGFPGVVSGTTAVEAVEATPVPLMFLAFTVNVYEVPLIRPVTVHVVELAVAVQVLDPGVLVTV